MARHNGNGTAHDATSGILLDAYQERALRTTLMAGSAVNADPLLIVEAQETAAEILAEYLAHCEYSASLRALLES